MTEYNKETFSHKLFFPNNKADSQPGDIINKTMLPDSRLKGYVVYFDSQKQTKLREAMIRKNSTKQKSQDVLRTSVQMHRS